MTANWAKFAIALAATMALGAGVGAATVDDPCTVDLVAGQWTDVGQIQVWDDGTNTTVRVEVDVPGWRITSVHIHVAGDPADIPQNKSGNPQIGKFDVNEQLDPPVTVYVAELLPLGCYVAVHADVCYDALTYVEDTLPATVSAKVAYPYSGGPSYFQTTVTYGGETYGPYNGWCIDTDHTIGNNTNYTMNVYSSYEALPAGLVENPGNLDLVNWILNQGYVGTASPGGYGTYTYGDVQRAIWTLVEDTNSTSGLGAWNQNRVNEILDAAETYGEGFVPGCGDVIAIILQPVNSGGGTNAQITIAQVTLIELVTECEAVCETAWPDINDDGVALFSGSSWATYIDYCDCDS